MNWLPQSGDSAWFRAKHPNSWWWTPAHDFMSMILQSVQAGNWQRGGGKGARPTRLERPDDRPPRVASGSELASRRAAQANELARRRAAKDKQKGA